MKTQYNVELMAQLIKGMMQEQWFIDGINKARENMKIAKGVHNGEAN